MHYSVSAAFCSLLSFIVIPMRLAALPFSPLPAANPAAATRLYRHQTAAATAAARAAATGAATGAATAAATGAAAATTAAATGAAAAAATAAAAAAFGG